jgi:hypothetical protein
MGGASYPKPDAERVNRTQPKFGWVDLPKAGRKGAAPALPPVRSWSAETRRWWRELWKKPQATQWDQTGSSVVPMAVLYQDMQFPSAGHSVASMLGEMRQHEDRHGLNPKAMLQLRWRILEEPTTGASTTRPAKGSSAGGRRGQVLSLITDNAKT